MLCCYALRPLLISLVRLRHPSEMARWLDGGEGVLARVGMTRGKRSARSGPWGCYFFFPPYNLLFASSVWSSRLRLKQQPSSLIPIVFNAITILCTTQVNENIKYCNITSCYPTWIMYMSLKLYSVYIVLKYFFVYFLLFE